MKLIRKLLTAILGIRGYLSWVSRIYLRMVRWGMLKKKYPELFYLKTIVKPDFYCLDIGANLGYYSYFLCKYAPKGKVYAVEPVPMFAKILQKNVRFENLTLFPYALGAENKFVEMQTPQRDGVFRHGLTKIVSGTATESNAQSYQVEMRVPDALFGSFERLDFLKCDVEGYEWEVFENMQACLEKYKPLIQVEIASQNREKMLNLLQKLGYQPHSLQNQSLVPLSIKAYHQTESDVYFRQHPKL